MTTQLLESTSSAPVRRETRSYSIDPSLDREIKRLVDRGLFRSKSHVAEEALREFINRHHATDIRGRESAS